MGELSRHFDLEVDVPRAAGQGWAARDSLAAVIKAERQIVLMRWAGIACAASLSPFLFHGREVLYIWGVCAAASLYSLFFRFYVIPRRPEWLSNGTLTTIGDTSLAGAVVYFSGGIQSEFYLVYFLIAVLSAVRFGGTRALLSIGVAAGSYTAIVFAAHAPRDLETIGTILFRLGFAGITGVFVGFVGDRARDAERQLEARAILARQALSEATAALTSSLQLEDVLETAARWAADLAGARRAEVVAHPPAELAEWLPSAEGRRERVARYQAGDGPDGAVREYPIQLGNQVLGTLRIVAGGEADGMGEVRDSLSRTFANRCGPALANAWAYTAVQLQALVDPTTGLANHRRFKEYLAEREQEAMGAHRPLSILMLDLDMFKEFNDTFGHLAGDRALRRVGQVLASCVGSQGLAARYGGDEFVAVLPGADATMAVLVGQAVLDGFRKAMEQRLDGLHPTVGLSIGAASAMAGDADYHTLIGRADLAMYLAKRGGGGLRAFSEVDQNDPLHSLVGSIMTQLSKADISALGGTRPQAGNRTRPRSTGPARTTEVIRTLIAALRLKDPALYVHCRNVARLCFRMARRLGLSAWETYDVGLAGLMHDLGKICVPDAILQKPSSLDVEEVRVIRQHSMQGSEILATVPSLNNVALMVRHHHEHYDGGGYPNGLQGERIPLASRIILVADAFDAITADRPYRRGRAPSEALRILRQFQGSQFDPRVVVTLTTLLSDLKAERARRGTALEVS